MKPYTGSDFDDFLKEERTYEEVTERAYEGLLDFDAPLRWSAYRSVWPTIQ